MRWLLTQSQANVGNLCPNLGNFLLHLSPTLHRLVQFSLVHFQTLLFNLFQHQIPFWFGLSNFVPYFLISPTNKFYYINQPLFQNFDEHQQRIRDLELRIKSALNHQEHCKEHGRVDVVSSKRSSSILDQSSRSKTHSWCCINIGLIIKKKDYKL